MAPCFLVPDGNGRLQPLQYGSFVATLKEWLSLAGFDPHKFSGHSLRRGGATPAFQAGVDPLFIRLQGGWLSDCWLLYVALSSAQRQRVSVAMQNAFLRKPGFRRPGA